MAGHLVMEEVRRRQVRMLPVDSEHNAIFQALEAGRKQDVARIILTASGGPFLDMAPEQLQKVTPEQALAHPNCDMGRKISIDSATLMNKGLEVIEAKWLFDVELDKIEVLVHPQSIVHSLVEFVDGSVVAQMGIPDMRIPIGYALSYPERFNTDFERFDFLNYPNLSFEQPDYKTFNNLQIAYNSMDKGGNAPAILNAANEITVAAFLKGSIGFLEIAQINEKVLNEVDWIQEPDLNDLYESDRLTRVKAKELAAL